MIGLLPTGIGHRSHRFKVPLLGRRQLAQHDTGGQVDADQGIFGSAQRQFDILLGVVGRKNDVHVLADVPVALDPRNRGVLIVVFPAIGRVGDESVTFIAQNTHAHCEIVCQRTGKVGLGLNPVVVADQQTGLGLEVLAGRACDQANRAARGVLAVQRALRAAQDFDTLDIVELEQAALDSGQIDIVQVNSHGGIEALQRIGLTDATNERIDTGVGATPLHQVQVGNRALQGVQVIGLQFRQLFSAECADGHRHFLEPLLATLGGHDDFLDGVGTAFLVLPGLC